MPANPITVHFAYTGDDYAEGWRAATRYLLPRRQRFSWASYFAFTLSAIVGGVCIVLSQPGNRSAQVVGSAALGIGLWYLYGSIVRFWRGHFALRREFGGLDSLHGMWEMQITDTGLHTQSPRATSDASWELYKSFVETNNLYLLSQQTSYVMIPKRAFDPGQLAAFRELVKEKLTVAQSPPSGWGFAIALAVSLIILVILYIALRLFAH